MLKIIESIIKPKAPKKPTVADCVAAQAVLDAKVTALLPKELQLLTLEQWQSFIKDAVKPEEPVDQPQTVSYTLEDGSVVVVAMMVPPLTLVEGSASSGYVVLSDKLGNRRQVLVTKPLISADS